MLCLWLQQKYVDAYNKDMEEWKLAMLKFRWVIVERKTIWFSWKIYDSWKVTLLPFFLENSEPKTEQEHKFWQFLNESLYKLIMLLNKPYFSLLCAN